MSDIPVEVTMEVEDVGVAIAGALICFAVALERRGIDANGLLRDVAAEIDATTRPQPDTPARSALMVTANVLEATDPG